MSDLPAHSRVVVAMSGGVDSSVSAALMVEAGFDVVGVTLQLYDHGAVVAKKGACCAGQDIYDAAKVAEKLGFPHYVLDYESRFQDSVIDDFLESYLRGETPLPCVRCNQGVKFKDLMSVAKSLKANALVTGHYVQRFSGDSGPELHQGLDPKKDQSYFLFATTSAQLDFLRFPLGGLTKAETRGHALRFGLDVSDKPDSQDICFVPNGNYAQLVKKLRPEGLKPGPIVHVNGSVIGQHEGIIHFTVGQRKGIGVGGSKDPLYVISLNPESCEVIVGPKEALGTKTITLKEVNWLSADAYNCSLDLGLECQVKIRSSSPAISAHIYANHSGSVEVVFDQGEYGVAPGQACVFYHKTRVLGGGWITSA